MINKSWINCLYRSICLAKVLFTIFSCKWLQTVSAIRHHLVQPVPKIIKPTPFTDNLFENYSPAGRQRMEFRCQFGVAYQPLKIQCNAVAHDQREVVLIIINIIQQLLPSSSVCVRSMFLLWAQSVVHDVHCARTDSKSPRIYVHFVFYSTNGSQWTYENALGTLRPKQTAEALCADWMAASLGRLCIIK